MKRVFAGWRKNNFYRPYTKHNLVEWVQSGNGYFQLLENLIDKAEREIHMETYIFSSDPTGLRVAGALLRAARRNVEVYLLVDAYGSGDLGDELTESFREAGIHFREYGKLFSRGRFHIGRRLHNKVLVIDGHISVVGGINISDQYNDTPGKLPWLDFAVIMRGDVSRRLQYLCRKRWGKNRNSYRSTRLLLKNEGPPATGTSKIRIGNNDFSGGKFDVIIGYRQAMREARKSILLVGGYFLPGGRSRRLMKSAIKKGVSIDVIVSEKSDVKVLVLARRYLYNWLLANGIGVYEYLPANVHGKVLIVDGKWTSIGSYDLNNLSTYSNIELNVDIDDEDFARSLSAQIENIKKLDCRKVTPETRFGKGTLFSQFTMWASYHIVKTLFVLSVILAGREEPEH